MIVVTEATGDVGREVVRFLDGTGILVRMGVLHPEQAKGMAGPDREVIRFDFNDPESIKHALSGARHLCLLLPTSENAVEMATLAIDIAKLNGVSHIVYQSMLGADAESGSRLLHWHHEVESYLREAGVHYTILRANMLMESLADMAHDSIVREGLLNLPLGDAQVSFLAARDLGAVCAEVMASTGHQEQIYTLTGSNAIPAEEFAVAIGRAIRSVVSYMDLTEEVARQQMTAMGLPQWQVDTRLEYYAFLRNGGGRSVTNDVERLTSQAPLDVWNWANLHKDEFRMAA